MRALFAALFACSSLIADLSRYIAHSFLNLFPGGFTTVTRHFDIPSAAGWMLLSDKSPAVAIDARADCLKWRSLPH